MDFILKVMQAKGTIGKYTMARRGRNNEFGFYKV